jgi:hypothetical protein
MSAGDAGRYPCSRCGELLRLEELLAHIEEHVARVVGVNPC